MTRLIVKFVAAAAVVLSLMVLGAAWEPATKGTSTFQAERLR